MAKVTPYPSNQTTPEQKKQIKAASAGTNKTIIKSSSGAINHARMIQRPNKNSLIAAANLQAIFSAAITAWRGLKTWKQARWSLCAFLHPAKINQWTGQAIYGGTALYIQCYMQQRTKQGKQPISPCAARITSLTASPFNYLP